MKLEEAQIHFLREYVRLMAIGLEGIKFVCDKIHEGEVEQALRVLGDCIVVLEQLNKGVPLVKQLTESESSAEAFAQALVPVDAMQQAIEQQNYNALQSIVLEQVSPAYEAFYEATVQQLRPFIDN